MSMEKMTELWQTVYIRQLLEIRIWAGKKRLC